ncbi:MAG: DUF2116 family Zn-ribbon domain-containing protein [Methanocellales archaeon]|nr:DUF2116 family Zn-ribbon domain-containing protein [Methanocellales archaeon]MDI6859670.1 DUF2116 family Zn-ribbon domain-containing protein [Methanocellales archaeon]MDI6902987.1 DUF2116 family Zn-ribbon domain-containing protein [Methanocellales archaeon]
MVRIVPHRHCTMCGKAVEPDETLCSEECTKSFNASQKRQKILFYGFIVLMIILIILSFGGKA